MKEKKCFVEGCNEEVTMETKLNNGTKISSCRTDETLLYNFVNGII